MIRGLILLLIIPTILRADDHWGTVPPVPNITLEHDQYSGIITVSWLSDSTFDKPVWYIIEVKQVDENGVIDPHFLWYRPFIPIRSNFNEFISLKLEYKNPDGTVKDWIRKEMFRVRAMWGA